MIRIFLTGTAVAVALATPAVSQEQPRSIPDKAPILEALADVSTAPPPEVSEFLPRQAAGELLGTDVIGLTLFDTSATSLGTVEDVLVDEGGKLSFVIVDVGDYVGKDKLVAFPFEALGYQRSAEDIRLVARTSRAELEAAPDFTSLADEMALHDAQSMTVDETIPKPAENATPQN